jgi:NADH:ubiquinone oxidoreductase subunit 3 (subunit A)
MDLSRGLGDVYKRQFLFHYFLVSLFFIIFDLQILNNERNI